MADINIHSRSDQEKRNFRDFIEIQTTGTIHRLPKPTRPISNTSPDVVITSSQLFPRCTIEVLDPLGSDHVPIKLSINSPHHLNPQQTPPPRTVLRFDKANWNKYRDYIQQHTVHLAPPETEDALYTTLDQLTTTLQQASNNFIPTSQIQPHRPKLPPHYLPLITRSRAFFRDYQRTQNPESLRLHR